MTLTSGTRLGPYEIHSAIGAGGMGEVWKARDTTLGRNVALKILPDHLALDPDRLARFKREAQILASLNHPNIGAIYGFQEADGVQAIVLELVDGSTLADRIARGPIPIDEALPIARQIAEALEAAHEQGIIHRDLKPANIKLRPDATVKVLDFGLAKALDPTLATSPGLSQSPTITTPAATLHGVILGTAAYMSPEQARGKPVDKRSDIWAFGCVLYEMLTGGRAFEGEDVGDTLAAIVRGEPDWTRLPSDVPAAIRSIVRRCLEKDRRARIPDIAVARYLLDETDVSLAPALVPVQDRRSTFFWKAATALLAVAAAAGLSIAYASRPITPPLARFFVSPPADGVFVTGGRLGASGIISPDGRTLAFTAQDESGNILLWVRPMDSLTAQPLGGTVGASFPFWSPDSRFIAYFSQDKLFKIPASGGPPQTVCAVPDGRGGAWSREDVIVFGGLQGLLFRVPSAGGEPVPATRLAEGQTQHRFPSFLPDARHLIFYVGAGDRQSGDIHVVSLDSGESKRLLTADSGGVYASSGHLLFARQGRLFAQSFDATALELAGDPNPVADRVESSVFNGGISFSVSENGVLAYGLGRDPVTDGLQMVWLDRQGKPIETIGPAGNYRGLDLAPDGTRVAVHRHEGEGGDIWVVDGVRGTTSRLTFDASQENAFPIWSPDGGRIVFASLRSGKWGLYRMDSDGGGNEERLLESDSGVVPVSWSPDGRTIVYWAGGSSQDLRLLDLFGGRSSSPLVATRFAERTAQISPDGKWLAYMSDDTGRNEVYVRPFPTGAGKWQVSTAGGANPRWRGDGRELFYTAVSPQLMAVAVNATGSTFEAATPQALFDSQMRSPEHPGGPFYSWAVSPDGQRFVVARPASNTSDFSGSPPIAVVLNWETALRK